MRRATKFEPARWRVWYRHRLSFVIALIVGPVIAAYAGVPSLFWLAAVLAVASAALLRLSRTIRAANGTAQLESASCASRGVAAARFLRVSVARDSDREFRRVAISAVESLEMPVTDHWKIYVGALLVSLSGTVPLILRDERQGKGSTIGMAVAWY